MKCIYCKHTQTEVHNSRETKGGSITWRRRYCSRCKKTFTTTESGYTQNLFVIKSNKKRQRFIYEKLFASIFSVFTSMKHRDNGKDALLAKKISESILKDLFLETRDRTTSTKDIIIRVYALLKDIDPALSEHYIYYSPYRRDIGKKTHLL